MWLHTDYPRADFQPLVHPPTDSSRPELTLTGTGLTAITRQPNAATRDFIREATARYGH
jgi:hypothetical protein